MIINIYFNSLTLSNDSYIKIIGSIGCGIGINTPLNYVLLKETVWLYSNDVVSGPLNAKQ